MLISHRGMLTCSTQLMTKSQSSNRIFLLCIEIADYTVTQYRREKEQRGTQTHLQHP